MNSSFEISCTDSSSATGDSALPCDFKDITILVNGSCATRVEDCLDSSIRKVVRLSPLRLSEWFASNWWRLRWEPEAGSNPLDWKLSHDTASAGGGFLWPSLTFSSDGDSILVCSRQIDSDTVSPLRYLAEFGEVIAAAKFEEGIDNFIIATIAELSTSTQKQTELQELWAEVVKERTHPKLTELRKLEALMGYDPEEAPAELVEQLLLEKGRFGPNAVCEVAAASKEKALDHLSFLDKAVRERGSEVCVSEYENVKKLSQRQVNSIDDLPWQRAERAARAARKAWGLKSGRVSNETLRQLFEIDVTDDPKDNLPLSAGLCNENAPERFRVALHQRYLHGRRFTLSRLVADSLMQFPGEVLLPATRAKTSRQKFQRAFASEFLCPIDDLRDFLGEEIPDDDGIDRAANHFEVSSMTVNTTLVNKGILPQDALAGWYV